MPGFLGGYRYHALDEAKPPWLVPVELDSPGVLDSPEYEALRANASDRDKAVAAGLATLDRRVYEQISSDGSASGAPAFDAPVAVLLAVALSVPAAAEDGLAAVADQHHAARAALKLPCHSASASATCTAVS